jgi:polar amino acid transport system substrate-binding protein
MGLLGAVPPGLGAALAPSGTLRAGVNLSNFLLVSSRDAVGLPVGVSPDMAAAVAEWLELGLELVPYESPGKLADAAGRDEWDIALIGAEPERALTVAFTRAYCEIEATCIVAPGSTIGSITDLDRPGIRIALAPRTAWGLWLDRNMRHATLVKAENYDEARRLFIDQKLDVLGGLRPKLSEDVLTMPGTRLLEGRFTAVQQALGVPRAKARAIMELDRFATLAVRSGFVAGLIASHGVAGLSVASADAAC